MQLRRRHSVLMPSSSRRQEEAVPESTDVQPKTIEVVPDSPAEHDTLEQFQVANTAPWYQSGYTPYLEQFTLQAQAYPEQFTTQAQPSWCPSRDPNAWITEMFSMPLP